MNKNEQFMRARAILRVFSPDVVRDIIALSKSEGQGLINELYGSSGKPSTTIFAILDPEYISNEDFEDVWLGMQLLITSQFRNPVFGIDEYEQIFTNAFSLPAPLARAAAASVEKEDSLTDGAKAAGKGWVEQQWLAFKEAFRKTVNQVPATLGIPWEIDQSQSYDLDFLYELKNVGIVARDLFSRARLMKGQAAFANSTGLMKMGGDVSSPGGLYGDIVRPLAARRIPGQFLGSFQPLVAGMMTKLGTALKSKVSDAQAGSASQDDHQAIYALANSDSPDPQFAQELRGVYQEEQGDISKLGDTIASVYGPEVAEKWEQGDIDGLFGEICRQAGDPSDEFSEGDVHRVLHEMGAQGALEGDVYEGGIFLDRMKAKRLLKKAAKRRNKRKRQSGKQYRRDAAANAVYRAQQELAQADEIPVETYQENDYYPDQDQDYIQGGGVIPGYDDWANQVVA